LICLWSVLCKDYQYIKEKREGEKRRRKEKEKREGEKRRRKEKEKRESPNMKIHKEFRKSI
jgi:hypothetical protein